MLTDTKSGSMRIALQQIYVNCYVEYVVKNPLSPTEHPGGVGVNNELFEASLEQFVVRAFVGIDVTKLTCAGSRAQRPLSRAIQREPGPRSGAPTTSTVALQACQTPMTITSGGRVETG
jgi:hypothetical protein